MGESLAYYGPAGGKPGGVCLQWRKAIEGELVEVSRGQMSDSHRKESPCFVKALGGFTRDSWVYVLRSSCWLLREECIMRGPKKIMSQLRKLVTGGFLCGLGLEGRILVTDLGWKLRHCHPENLTFQRPPVGMGC